MNLGRSLVTLGKGLSKVIQKDGMKWSIGAGLVAGLLSDILAVKATVKATKKVAEKKEELGRDLTKTEIIKTCWVGYIPAAACFALCLLGVIGGAKIGNDKILALTAAASASERALEEYKAETKAAVSEEKYEEIEHNVTKREMERPSPTKNSPIDTGLGVDTFYDPWSDRYFKASITGIKAALVEVNNQILDDGEASLNDFYYEIGLRETRAGEVLLWHPIGYTIQPSCNEVVYDDVGNACIKLGFNTDPKVDK